MAGYRETFGANVDFAYRRGLHDIAGNLERGMNRATGSGSGIANYAKEMNNTKGRIRELSQEMSSLTSEMSSLDTETEEGAKQFKRLRAEFEAAQKSAQSLKKQLKEMPFDALEKGVGKLTKGLIGMNTSILTIGFDFLVESIKRVYELQERWTRAIGGFNMRLGGMTKGLAGAQKAAVQWSGVIRGLTNGDINEGIQMFSDFTDAIGRVVEQGDEFQKFGLQMARGFNLGGAASGQLTKVFENLGNNGDSAAETIKALVKGANAAHVPTNLLAKDLAESSTYMARFGKEGQQTLVTGAAWARKYTISLDQLRKSVEGLDAFDEAAKTASKLNATFGTMINSMDLMLEDDPAKRLEMIRQQFLAQGTTFDKLTPKQRRYLSETLKLTEDQTAALLSSKNAGESYADFQEKAAKKEKAELSAKQLMQKQLQATAQTMYAFGSAFDRITVAIGKAIKPLLQVFGLAKSGDKDFKSFGARMESITVTIEKFFDSLAANEKWNLFMVELAKDLKKAGSALSDFVMSGKAADLVGDIADGMKRFYVFARDIAKSVVPALRPMLSIFLELSKHIDKLVIAWGSLKALNFGRSLGLSSGSNVAQSFSGTVSQPGMISKLGGGQGIFNRGVAGVGLGLTTASALGGGAGANIGGAVGGAIGAFIPLIGPLMGPLGAALGKGIEELFGGTGKTELEKAMDSLAESTKNVTTAQNLLDSLRNRREAQDAARTERNNQADSVLLKLKNKKVTLDESEQDLAAERLKGLQNFGLTQEQVTRGLNELKSGPLDSELLKAIAAAQANYKTTTEELDVATKQVLEDEKVKAAVAKADLEKKEAEVKKATVEQEIATLERNKAIAIKNVNETVEGPSTATKGALAFAGLTSLSEVTGIDKKAYALQQVEADYKKKIDAKMLEKTNLDLAVNQSQLGVLNQQLGIERRAELLRAKADKGDAAKNMTLAEFAKTYSQELKDSYGLGPDQIAAALSNPSTSPLPKFASGGVFSRPTAALIGESGPEAVVPLSRQNMAGSSSAGGSSIVTQIADITLDGQKVGRALVRSAITGRN